MAATSSCSWWLLLLLAGALACESQHPSRREPAGEAGEIPSDAGNPGAADAEGPACQKSGYQVDHDGDGYRVRADADTPGAFPVCWGTLTIPDGYVAGTGQEDCDDNDPNAYVVVYRDADEDGFVLPDDSRCGNFDTPSYWAATGRQLELVDCDDDDAQKLDVRYMDADGDGYGAGQALCIDASEPGYSRSNTDCDDVDETQHPSATEVASDGADSDCDGFDGFGTEAPLDQISFELDPACELADLAIVYESHGMTCFVDDMTFVIGNRGGARATGHLVVSAESGPYEIDVDLLPGESIVPLTVHGEGNIEFGITGLDECSKDNNFDYLEPANCG